MSVRPISAVVSLLFAGLAVLGAQQKTPPVFRSGVELVLVDATVLDKDGLPIADLNYNDFSVTVAGKKRPIVASQFVPSGRSTRVTTQAAPASSLPGVGPVDLTAALPASDTRSIIVIVDVESIRSGEGRIGMQNLADYFDTLPASDLIGVVSLPWSGRIELTADRRATRSTLTKMFGTDGQMRSCTPTLGEAAAESENDVRGATAYLERRKTLSCPPMLARGTEIEKAQRECRVAMEMYRTRAHQTLMNVSSIAVALQDRPGRRAVVLVSEGLYGDEETSRDLVSFGAALERIRVQMFAIHLDFPFVEASAKMASSETRRLDDHYGFEAMATAAAAGGGEAIRAISRATPAITRIDAAMSGFYVLAFDRIASDKDGTRLSLKIDVSRKGADVRARTHVTLNPR